MENTPSVAAPLSIQGPPSSYGTHEQRQEALLFESVLEWFNKNPGQLESILRVLTKKDKGTPISLTLLDWFVSSYSKIHNCAYKNSVTGEISNVHEQYLLQLKGFSKKRSDPFCRSQRFKLTVMRPGDHIETITTSVRQVSGSSGIVSRLSHTIAAAEFFALDCNVWHIGLHTRKCRHIARRVHQVQRSVKIKTEERCGS